MNSANNNSSDFYSTKTFLPQNAKASHEMLQDNLLQVCNSVKKESLQFVQNNYSTKDSQLLDNDYLLFGQPDKDILNVQMLKIQEKKMSREQYTMNDKFWQVGYHMSDFDSIDNYFKVDNSHEMLQSIFGTFSFNNYLMQENLSDNPQANQQALLGGKSSLLKNTNMPKFYIRLFFKYYRTFLEIEDLQIQKNLSDFIMQYERRYQKNPKLYYLMRHLTSLLRLEAWPSKNNKISRKIMREIIQKKARKQILANPQIKLKLTYLNAMKVYSLRCSSSDLAQRLQSR